MTKHLLAMFGFAAFGVCAYAGQEFYFSEVPDLQTMSYGLLAISAVLLLIGHIAMNSIESVARKAGYAQCQQDEGVYRRLLSEQKEREE